MCVECLPQSVYYIVWSLLTSFLIPNVLNRLFDWTWEMEAIAKHDFQATADDELSFHRGAKLKVSESIRSWFLWSPYVIGQTTIFLPCDFYLLPSSFFSPNLSGRRLYVYHTSTHGVALVRIYNGGLKPAAKHRMQKKSPKIAIWAP